MEESLSKPFKPPKKLTPKKYSPEKKRVSFTKDTRSPENKFKMKHKERPKSHKIKIRVEMENKKSQKYLQEFRKQIKNNLLAQI